MSTETMGLGIYKALADITREIGAISKNKKCTQGAVFSYRGIDDVYNALNPLLGEHGVFMLPVATERTGEHRQTRKGASMEVVTVRMTYRFCHADGSSVECVTIGEAMDSGDKATNKAMAIAHKYAILQTFCVPTGDMEDPDSTAEELAPLESANQHSTKDQTKAIMDYLTKKHGDNRDAYRAEFSDFFGRKISSYLDLTQDEISAFLDAINNNRAAIQ